jgi:hypothetical protein
MQARANAFGVVTGACIFGEKRAFAFGASISGTPVVRHRRLLAALF